MTKSWHISRRTMLRGVGAAVALPWLEAMSAMQAAETQSGNPPLRMVFVYHPLGAETTAWKGVTGAETRPSDVFARMFGDAKEDRRRKSILDVAGEDARQLKLKLGARDHRRLDEYLDSVRSLERQIADFEQGADKRPEPPIPQPGEPENLRHHVRLMIDL